MVTIHNNPEEMKLPVSFKHLRIELPDIPTADISKHFNDVYEHIEAARDRKHGPSCRLRDGYEMVEVLAVQLYWCIAVLV